MEREERLNKKRENYWKNVFAKEQPAQSRREEPKKRHQNADEENRHRHDNNRYILH